VRFAIGVRVFSKGKDRGSTVVTACRATGSFRSETLEVLVGPCELAPGHKGPHGGPALWVRGGPDGSLVVLSGLPPGACWEGRARPGIKEV